MDEGLGSALGEIKPTRAVDFLFLGRRPFQALGFLLEGTPPSENLHPPRHTEILSFHRHFQCGRYYSFNRLLERKV